MEFVKVFKFLLVSLYKSFVKLKAKENENLNFIQLIIFRSKLIFLRET